MRRGDPAEGGDFMKIRRRTLVMVGLFLLAGAVVNVGVAWVLVGAPTRAAEAAEYFLADEGAERVRGLVDWPPDWPVPDYLWRFKALGRQQSMAGYGDYRTYRLESGWPFVSVYCDSVGHLSVVHSSGPHYGSVLVPQALQRGRWFRITCDRLPIVPLFPGFLLNTLFYAVVVGAILALPLSLVPLRCRLRARRGRCPKCNYDRAGLAGPCPECGAAR
jgi:hypothetical protein